MAELLLELTVEEMPSAHQQMLADALGNAIGNLMQKASIAIKDDALICHATPRRLIVAIKDLPQETQASTQESKGPKEDAPQQAIDGFLHANNITLDECVLKATPTPKDADAKTYFFVKNIPAQPLEKLLPEWINDAIIALPHPKSMRFADNRFRFIRPLRNIMAYFDNKPLKGELNHQGLVINYSDNTQGNYMSKPASLIRPKNYDDYSAQLQKEDVILEKEKRITMITESLPKNNDGNIKLINEVAGLCEYPLALMGEFDQKFLELPDFLLESVLNYHQKHFLLRDAGGNIRNEFLFIVNGNRSDEANNLIIKGNERVLHARLADAEFFITQDIKQSVEARNDMLGNLVFYQKLGTMAQRVKHIQQLGHHIGNDYFTDIDSKQIVRASLLAKNDLVSLTVREFPELQGKMGGFYAKQAGENEDVAMAVAQHYLPVHDGDNLPTNDLGLIISLADKLDILSGFFVINELPTGSKDPFALRRTAIAMTNILEAEKMKNVRLYPLLMKAVNQWLEDLQTEADAKQISIAMLDFINERQITKMKKMGMRYDVTNAICARQNDDSIPPDGIFELKLYTKILQEFCELEDGKAMLSAVKRANGIIKKQQENRVVDEKLLAQTEEISLYNAIKNLNLNQSFSGQLEQVATLRPSINAFFDNVTVMAEDEALKQNRLNLLCLFRDKVSYVADFEKIQS